MKYQKTKLNEMLQNQTNLRKKNVQINSEKDNKEKK